MKFWQIVQGVSRPDLSALSALIMRQSPCRRTHTHTHTRAERQNAHCSSLVNWSGQSTALCLNFVDYASFLYSLPWKWVSVMLFCQWTSEPVTWRKMERKRVGGREKVYVTCHSTSQSVESFLLIHHSTFGNEAVGKAEGQTNSTLSAILLSLLIMWDNYSYIPRSTPSPYLQQIPPSFPSSSYQ